MVFDRQASDGYSFYLFFLSISNRQKITNHPPRKSIDRSSDGHGNAIVDDLIESGIGLG